MAVVIRDRKERVLVRRCQPGERWAGLWDFPRVGCDDVAELSERMHSLFSATVIPGERLAQWKHGVTRYRITLSVYSATLAAPLRISDSTRLRWLSLAELGELPLCVTGRKIVGFLCEEQGIAKQ